MNKQNLSGEKLLNLLDIKTTKTTQVNTPAMKALTIPNCLRSVTRNSNLLIQFD